MAKVISTTSNFIDSKNAVLTNIELKLVKKTNKIFKYER